MSDGRPATATGQARRPAGRVTTGYSIMMPAGWRQIPTGRESGRVIGEIADEVLGRMRGHVSRDKLALHRVELQHRLSAMVEQARRGGAIDVYVPVQYIRGLIISASIVVARGALPAPDGITGAEMVALLAAQESGTTAATAGRAIAARREHVAEPEDSQQIEARSRRVDYLIPVPRTRDDWLIVTFVTLGDGDPDSDFTKLLVEWFDAVMATFEWTTAGQE